MKFTKNHLFFLAAGILVLSLISFFAYRYFAPFGAKIIYQFSAEKNSDKVSGLLGAKQSENIENNAQNTLTIPQQIIRNSIVTFNLKLLSKPIAGVWVNLKFKGDPKELKIGVRGSIKDPYLYKPLYQTDLENLKNFENINESLIFWQKEKNYQNFAAFLEKPPQNKTTAVYFFDPTDISKLQTKNTSTLKEAQTIVSKLLRSSHSFLVKIDNGHLNLIVEKQDENYYKGPDVLRVEIYKGSKKVFTKDIPDDGDEENDSLKLLPQKEIIDLKNLERGIYRVNLLDQSTGADVYIKSLTINQAKLVFLSPIFVVDEKPTSLWTTSNTITAQTYHQTSAQTIKIDKKDELEIKEALKSYSFNLASSSATHLLDIPKNDLIIGGDQYFFFNPDSFFDPNPLKTTDLTKVPDFSKVDYVIANYQKVKRDGDWKIAQVFFNPQDFKIDGDKLYFSLEAPELANSGGEIAINNLEVTVNKPGWFNNQNYKEPNKGIVIEKESGELNFFQKIWQKITFQPKPIATPTPKVSFTPKPTSTPSPTPMASASSSLLIRVLNGGADSGVATGLADLFKNNGFTNVKAENAQRSDYKGVIINYRQQDNRFADKIEQLLRKSYNTIIKTPVTTTSAEIIVIVGQK